LRSKPIPIHRIPKYERLQKLAQRYPSLDPMAIYAYLTMLGVAGEVAAVETANLATYGLGEGRYFILALLLEQFPRPLPQSELAELSGVTKGNMTGLIDGLVRDGHVKREDPGEDRRVTPIALTASGRRLVEKIMPERFTGIAGLMSELSPAEQNTLVSLLNKVQAGLPAMKRS